MLYKNEFLEELLTLRDQLRAENENAFICNDEALVEMVNKMPLKTNDFLAVPGIDKDFIKDYSKDFLEVINNYRSKKIKEVKVSKKAYKVLNNYKDRLTNLSKNNQNLYMGRIEKLRNFDLATLEDDENLIDFLTNKKTRRYNFELPNERRFKDLTNLYRNVNKELKETGAYNLYIAYPYIEGYLRKEKFPIKAPLLFFPVALKRSRRNFYLQKDDKKDIIYNNDLLLMISKLDKESLKEKDPFVASFSRHTLTDEVFDYYEKNGVALHDKFKKFEFEMFESLLKAQFERRKYRNFELRQYLVLGRYKPYSSMIQKDMNAIIESNKYNELLEGLIDEENLYKKEKEVVFAVDKSKINEDSITYINELNDSQENVIDLLNKEQKLVIFGPPGTGKSQTITSLIANAILNKENVLVVSEKRAALDVIYSRLKNASKYAMFLDDAENKTNFYNMLSNFIDPTPPIRTINNDRYQSEAEITELLNTLDRTINLLFGEVDGFNVSELLNKYLKDREVNEELTPKSVYEMFNRHFGNLSYSDLKGLEDKFDSNSELKKYLEYHKIVSRYPVVKRFEKKLTRSSKIEFKKFSEGYLEFVEDYNTSGLFRKIQLRKIFLKMNKGKLLYFAQKGRYEKKYLKLLLKDARVNNYLLENINRLPKLEASYLELNKLEIKYLNMLTEDELVKDIIDISKFREYLFRAYYTGYLEEFKALHQEDLSVIDEYQDTKERLEALVAEKILITTESFEMELYKQALNFSNAKRIMDIKRILEAAKKPSVNEFINHFQPELFESIKIWMMTPEVVSSLIPLEHGLFDLVIFDEASQMYVEKGIPSIYRAKKVVIAGDPKQLRPSSLGFGRIDNEDELFEEEILQDVSLDAKSLLDLARYKYKETLLNYHYRSNYEELISFSNYAFYDGKLIVSPNQKESPKPPIEYVHVEEGIFHNRQNVEEAKEVVKIIKKIFRTRKNNETIGVITFNSAQRDLIENHIDKEIFKKGTYQRQFEEELMRTEDNEDKSLFIKNIENVQGDERDIIIFSMGYAKDKTGTVKRRFGWLNHEGGQNRLNVAVTRAKKKIYFVSSLYPEEFKVEDLQGAGPKLLKDFMRYCYFISNGKKDLAKLVLQELHSKEEETQRALTEELALDIKKRLEGLKYNVHTSIGAGEHYIDLAIYDEEEKEYKLGIICDIVNDTNVTARRNLLHQEKYLKARGWNVYRVFSNNWYIDANKELRKIRKMLKEVE